MTVAEMDNLRSYRQQDANKMGILWENAMESLIETPSRRKLGTPKKRTVKRISADEHLRAEPANKRALDQGIAQIERGDTIRFDPRKPRK